MLFSAVISADTAVLAEKDKKPGSPFWVMHRGKKWLVPETSPHMAMIFQGCLTITTQEATIEKIKAQMQLLHDGQNCQHLVLMVVDPEEDDDIKTDACRQAEALLKKPGVKNWVTGMLYSRWLDINDALTSAIAANKRKRHLYELLQCWQNDLPVIKDVASAWDKLSWPDKEKVTTELEQDDKFNQLAGQFASSSLMFKCAIKINDNPDSFWLTATIQTRPKACSEPLLMAVAANEAIIQAWHEFSWPSKAELFTHLAVAGKFSHLVSNLIASGQSAHIRYGRLPAENDNEIFVMAISR